MLQRSRGSVFQSWVGWIVKECVCVCVIVIRFFAYAGSSCAPRCSRSACRCGTSWWWGRVVPSPCTWAPTPCPRSPPHRPVAWQSLAWSSAPPHSQAPQALLGWKASFPVWTWRTGWRSTLSGSSLWRKGNRGTGLCGPSLTCEMRWRLAPLACRAPPCIQPCRGCSGRRPCRSPRFQARPVQ